MLLDIEKEKEKEKKTFEKVMGSILASGLTVMVGVVVYYVSTQSFYLLGTIFFVIDIVGNLKNNIFNKSYG